MGGGLSKPTRAYTVNDSAAKNNKDKDKRAKSATALLDDAELDELEALEAKKEEEIAARQKIAVDHVVENLFPYAPVKVQTQKYPAGSPLAGKAYLWITVDEDKIKRMAGAATSPLRYPTGVAIDPEGNVFVSEAGSTGDISDHAEPKQSRKISAASLIQLASTNQPPPPPKSPRLLEATQTSLSIRWSKSHDTTVDRYEAQYRLADSPNNLWACLVANTTVHEILLENIHCYSPYEFRVRVHNPAGWSDYSVPSDIFWTLPGIPGIPRSPVAGTLTNTYISLFWSYVESNGAPPVVFTLEMRNCDDGKGFETVYEGCNASFVVSYLKPKTPYIFRIKATNSVGSTPYVETRGPIKTLAYGKPEIVELTPAESTASYDRWVTCWDPKTEQVFYFNKYTSQRTTEEPPELAEVREQKGLVAVEEIPEMLFRRKRFRFHRDMRQALTHNSNNSSGSSSLAATLPIPLHRETMYEDTLACFQKLTAQQLVAKTKISFEGEAGIDSGGLTKDWYLQISKLAVDKKRGILKPCDHGQFEIDSASAGHNPKHLQEFKFLGKLMAKAIFDRQSVDLPFTDTVFKYLLHLPIEMEDLAHMDAQFHKSLVWMLENEISGVIDETFSVEVESNRLDAKGKRLPPEIYDLKENGRDVPVTDVNKSEYVHLIVQWRTEFGIQSQLEALKQGFFGAFPNALTLPAISVFDLAEFKALVNGKPTIDVEELRANTVFQGGYNEHTQVVLWLWQALRSFTLEKRGLFLKFMTGTNKIPLDGLEPPLNLTKSDLDPQALPRTHTCFNQLVLPEYQSYETLVDKITFAITNAEGFELS